MMNSLCILYKPYHNCNNNRKDHTCFFKSARLVYTAGVISQGCLDIETMAVSQNSWVKTITCKYHLFSGDDVIEEFDDETLKLALSNLNMTENMSPPNLLANHLFFITAIFRESQAKAA